MAVCCSVGHQHGSDPLLLCLWRRPAAAAPIQPLTWEPPYATGAALKKTKKKKQTLLKTQLVSSLVAQWLRIWHYHCCGLGSIPDPETLPHVVKKKRQISEFLSWLSG